MKKLILLPFLLAASVTQLKANPFDPNETLTATAARLSAIPDKSNEDHFALGAVHFLHGIEKSLQIRWQHNATFDDMNLPVLRLPVAPNPNAQPFTVDLITRIFAEMRNDMDASRAALANVSGDVSLAVNLADLWFDVNMNTQRDPGESIMEIGLGTFVSPRQRSQMEALPTALKVQFDTADVAWLTAYTHLISGISEMVLAFDPSESISEVLSATAAMDELRGVPFQRRGFLGTSEAAWLDQFAMVYGALNRQPNAENTRAAHAHFLEMISENKVFWAALALETDNQMEWIPNDAQTAALGFDMPVGTGVAWQAILADAEAILNGELLLIHWRVSPQAGINVKEMFLNPPVVDIVDWLQGSGLLPYMQRGPVATSQSMQAFERLVSGNALSFSFLLN